MFVGRHLRRILDDGVQDDIHYLLWDQKKEASVLLKDT